MFDDKFGFFFDVALKKISCLRIESDLPGSEKKSADPDCLLIRADSRWRLIGFDDFFLHDVLFYPATRGREACYAGGLTLCEALKILL